MPSPTRILILPDQPIGTINPYLHGQFAEHLGELVYPGVYVGPDSPIPNTDGVRDDVVAALRPLEVPVLRWPGGCFADTYHWRDGVGPRERRPKRVNVHWGMAEEPNAFGTHEFAAFCRAIGAVPYFAANLGSASPQETRDWVEYCNFAGDSALAGERRANGADEPLGVAIWGVGNENWGCGGNMSAPAYAERYARYRSFVYDYPGTKVDAVACGANEWDWAWTEQFFEQLSAGDRLRLVQGYAGHYYCGSAGSATEYTEEQWLELLAKASAIDGIVAGHRAIMDRYDPERRVKLLYDEWGAWHPADPAKPAGGLYQQNTIRDACVAALTLDIFHNHADKLWMCNIAQLVNVLQAVLLVDGDQVVRTPTYHVFDLYRPHKGGQALRLVSGADIVSDGGAQADRCRRCYRDGRFPGLRAVQGSASVKEGALCVTLVNAHPADPVEVEVEIEGARIDSAEIVTLAAGDIRARNTFDRPDVVRPAPAAPVAGREGRLRVTLPAASVSRVTTRPV